MPSNLPYARLSGFYLFYYAALGIFLPYWSLYLKGLGYSAVQIGTAVGVYAGTRIFAPVFWGWCADQWHIRLRMIQLASLLAPFTFLLPLDVHMPAWLYLQMLLFSFCLNAVMPQLEALTFNHLREQVQHYGRVRVWGSIGFVLAVLIAGPVLDRVGLQPVPWIVAGILLAMSLFSLSVPDAPVSATHAESTGGMWDVISRPEVWGLLLACFLSQLSFAPYYGFFSLYLAQYAYSNASIGMLWALGVIAEIGVFLVMAQLLHRFGSRRLMLWALALTAARWAGVVVFVKLLPILVLIQFLHLASFGIYHAVAVHQVHHMFRGSLQGRGQAFYSAVSFGAGGAIGSLMSGYLWEKVSPDSVYWAAALSAAIGWWVAWRWLGPDIRSAEQLA